jgi:hypothetical protein
MFLNSSNDLLSCEPMPGAAVTGIVLVFLASFERSVAIERLERLEQPFRFLIAAVP